MRSSLFDYEWQFLTQMITRIHYTASYEELCRLLLEDQLPPLTARWSSRPGGRTDRGRLPRHTP